MAQALWQIDKSLRRKRAFAERALDNFARHEPIAHDERLKVALWIKERS